MSKRGKGPQDQKGYKPSKKVKQLVKEKLQLLKSGKPSKSWDKKKFDFVEKLFQSYADMIYFLESTASNPELYDVFKKDLDDFFDIRAPYQAKQLHPFIGVEMEGIQIVDTAFTRLIFASVVPPEDPGEEHFENNRLKLTNMLQSIIYAKMWFVLQHTFGNDDQVTKSAMRDLANSLGWTSMAWKPAYEKDHKPKRYLDFPAPYVKR